MRLKIILLLIWATIHAGFAQDINYARSIVATLASPKFIGRGYTANGNKLAAEYIAGEFKKDGLTSLTKNYFQKFKISVNTFPNRMFVDVDADTLKPGIDYLVDAGSPSISGTFGILKTDRKDISREVEFKRIAGASKNQFILIDNRDKTGEDKETTKETDQIINYLKYSADVHYAGVIILTSEKLTWDASQEQYVRPVITTTTLPDVKPNSIINITIDSDFKKNFETQNVIGMIPGSSVTDSFLVFTAHYDHLGQMGKQTYFPGANDNASGVAMLLNLARHYSQNQPKYSILFIAFSGEELGLLGAKEYTEHPLFPLSRIKFLLNFDLAGTGDEGIRVVNGSVFKAKFDILAKLNEQLQLLPKIDIRGEACISDHCMFYMKGVPCFYIYTQGGIRAYHDVYDKAETLPLTEFTDYCTLMIKFCDQL